MSLRILTIDFLAQINANKLQKIMTQINQQIKNVKNIKQSQNKRVRDAYH